MLNHVRRCQRGGSLLERGQEGQAHGAQTESEEAGTRGRRTAGAAPAVDEGDDRQQHQQPEVRKPGRHQLVGSDRGGAVGPERSGQHGGSTRAGIPTATVAIPNTTPSMPPSQASWER